MNQRKSPSRLFIAGAAIKAVLVATALIATAGAASADALRDKWCSKVHLRFFVGGGEGDAFGTIVYNGAKQAAADTGAQVDYVFSGWQPETMIQQLREAIAAKPDGIAMMGHPSDAPIMPLAEDAAKAGIRMMYQNVDVPTVRAKFGGGYVGAQLDPQGRALGEEAVRRFGLKAGGTAVVFGPFNDSNRAVREA
jgi:simple sugar transport system substrate-binding protein